MKRRLHLRKETLKRLVDNELRTVQGGTHTGNEPSVDYCAASDPRAGSCDSQPAEGAGGGGCPLTTVSDPT